MVYGGLVRYSLGCGLALLLIACGSGSGGKDVLSGGDGGADASVLDSAGRETTGPGLDAGCQSDDDCDDHISCTVDKCIAGTCSNTPDDGRCGVGETCNLAKGGCFKTKSCFKDEDCIDFIECTVEGCNQETKLCEVIYDHTRCPGNALCVPFEWFQEIDPYKDSEPIDPPDEDEPYVGCVATKECSKDSDCGSKNNPCVEVACLAGFCAYWPDSESGGCSDGDPCNGEEECALPGEYEDYGDLWDCFQDGDDCEAPEYGWTDEWYCEEGYPKTCNDGDPCTVDWCNSTDGSCEHELAQDGEACEGGVCQGGECKCTFEECQGTCCEPEEVCSATGCCEPSCNGKSCGGDGCGGSCGQCPGDQVCMNGSSCVDVGLKWVSIPGGTFQMGCSPGDSYCGKDEEPSHSVTLSSFEMLETEVTEGQYLAVTGEDPSDDYGGGGGSNSPVENVTWFDAQAYCESAGGRLPTEAEWEYAARGGTTTKYSCGDASSCLDGIAWYDDNSGGHKHDVKGKDPNGYELYDMSGNVWEWVSDWYDSDYYDVSPDNNPQGPNSGSSRVIRGGGFGNGAYSLRVSNGVYFLPSGGGYVVGFRCARSE